MRAFESVHALVIPIIGAMHAVDMCDVPVSVNPVMAVMDHTVDTMIPVDHRRAVHDPPRNRAGMDPYIDMDRLCCRGDSGEGDGDSEQPGECETVHG